MSLERRASKAATNDKPNRKLSVASGEGLVIWRAYNRLLLDYARQHERTTIVTSLAALIANDRAVFERVNTLLDDRLSVRAAIFVRTGRDVALRRRAR